MTANVLEWLKQAGGEYDAEKIALKDYQEMGMGVVALQDIPEDTVLFSVPDDLLLTASNTSLRGLIRAEDWETLEEDGGWSSLILSMMWEDARGKESKWYGYMSSLPQKFDTPMFWTDEQISELNGTDIAGKIGRKTAEDTYQKEIVPLLNKYEDLFTSARKDAPEAFSFNHFHIQGSRILSRSFSVPSSRAGRQIKRRSEQEDAGDVDGDVSMTTAVGDVTQATVDDEEKEEAEEEEEEDDDDEAEEEVMVPVADMLNAAYERDNARLFHEEGCLNMVSTKLIPAGEQIFNTYGSPANSYLLRKYGHVDVYPLRDDIVSELPEEYKIWPMGNEGDEVEITGDVVVQAALRVWSIAAGGKTLKSQEEEEQRKQVLSERVDWWLEEGEEDTFVLTYPPDEIPEATIAFARLLLEEDVWEKARDKGKVPKPKVETTESGLQVLDVLLESCAIRMRTYTCSIESDLAALSSGGLEKYDFMARVVRTGELRVLAVTRAILNKQRDELYAKLTVPAKGNKRKAENLSKGGKKSKSSGGK